MKKILLWLLASLILLPMLFVLALSMIPEKYIILRLEAAASRAADGEVRIGSLSLQPLRLRPIFSATDIVLYGVDQTRILSLDSIDVSIHLKWLFAGEVVLPRVQVTRPHINLVRKKDASTNWQGLGAQATELGVEETEGTPLAPGRIFVPRIGELIMTDLQLDYADTLLGLTLKIIGEMDGEAERATRLAAEGILNDVPVSVNAELPSLTKLQSVLTGTFGPLPLNAKVEFAESSILANGNVGLWQPATLDVDLKISLVGTKHLEQITGIALPALPPLQLQGKLIKDRGDYVLRRFDGAMAQTDLQGDIRLNPDTSPVTLYANIIATRLDLDDLAGLIGITPDESLRIKQDTRASGIDRMLPDGPIDLIPLTRYFNGAIEFRADAVETKHWPVESVDTRVEIDGTRVAVPAFEVGLAGGRVSGSLKLDAGASPPQSVAALKVQRINLREVMKSAGIDDDSFGILGGEVKVWTQGNSIAQFASNLDGGMVLMMVDGKLDALLAELAGLDLLESITLIIKPGKVLTDINCAYLDVLATKGTVDIATLVLDTTDTLFFADGQIDLSNETLNLTIEPHPKDVSLLSSQSGAVIKGNISNPSVQPGSGLTARTVMATSLAALASPLAALIPFVQLGTQDDSHYCSGLVDTLNDERKN